MGITNRQMRSYVEATRQFTNNNKTVWTTWEGKFYTVYSYGRHFPMYAYDTQAEKWYGNKDKFSRTTTTHQNLARPSNREIEWVSTDEFKALLEARSTVNYVTAKLSSKTIEIIV